MKWFIFLLVVNIFATWFIFLLVVHVVATSPTPEVMESITDRKILKNIPNHMNEEYSACGNYFEYACGKYAERHINESYSNDRQMLEKRVLEDLRELMEELHISSGMAGFNESSLDAKVLRYYQTCWNASSETWSLEHFLKLASPGEDFTWPLLTPDETKWPKDQFKWMDTLAYFQRHGLTNVLINVDVIPNSEFSADPVLKLSMPSFKDYYRMDYLETLNKTQFEFRRSPPLFQLEILEILIESIGRQQPYERSVYYMSVEQIEASIGLNFRKFIEAIVGHPISPQYRILVKNLKYFVALKRQMESTDAEVLATYLMTRFIIYIEKNILTGGDRTNCLIDLIRSMNLAWNLLYKERFQNPETLRLNIQEVEHIFEQLRRQLLNNINQNRLGLSEEQKGVVIKKVQDVVLNIGNVPKDLDHRSFATRYFENLDFPSVELDYGRVQLKILEIHIRNQMDQLLLPGSSSEKDWDIPEPIRDVEGPTSAYYVADRNFIVMPYALLQEPFFMYDSQDVFKYSLMGFALAHELMHAIGSNIVFDVNGNYQEVGKEILISSKFQNGLDCMNRPKTDFIDERLADIEGLRLAFSTYSSQNTRNRNDIHLGAFSQEQIFFLNLAQFSCSKRSSGILIDHDDHPLRLLQIVNNNDDFDTAFGCQRKSESCHIW